MNKIIKVPLSVKGLNELKKKIDNLSVEFKETEKNISDELIGIAEEEIKKGYATSPYEEYEENFTIGKDNKSAYVEGTQVLYREYGTGSMGMNDPHPMKNMQDIPLNPYNSGRTIRTANKTMKPETGILPRRTILDI